MSSNYNTRARAAEVLVENGQPRLIRERDSFAQMVANELNLLEPR
jgi:diaminopimelate decarboxylase